jgi:TPP-dependent pyruvate/acetoin dehydrogenase alpha subunit
LRKKAESYLVTADVVDGMDVIAIEQAARDAVTTIREGSGPRFLECRTYRFRAHSMFDPQRYRQKEEVERWRSRDPILVIERALREAGVLDERKRTEMDEVVAREIEDAIQFAEAAAWEPVEDLLKHVHAVSP